MKKRVISAVVAILIALPFVIIGKGLYAFGVGLIALQGYREILNLKKTHKPYPIVIKFIGLIMYLLLIYADYIDILAFEPYRYLLIIMSLMLLIPSVIYKNDKYTIQDAFNLIGMIIFLGIGFNSLLLVRNAGLALFIYLVSIPMITDTFALLFGSKFGKHKMCPEVSPKKSWEGFFGGLVLGTVIPCLIYGAYVEPMTFKVVFVTLILSIMGQIGDLLFSKIKRENGIKDFSNIMPGHGGALDRVDSTLVIFTSYLYLIALL